MKTKQLLQRFYELLDSEDAVNAARLGLQNFTLRSFLAMDANEVWTHIQADSISETMQKLNIIYFWVGFLEIRNPSGAKLKNLQAKFNQIVLSLENRFTETEYIKIEEQLLLEIEKQATKYTNLQVLRGARCNVRCQMCFIHQLDKNLAIDVGSLEFLQHVMNVEYSMSGLFKAMLHARIAYGLNEILFSSYGDPLANKPGLLPQEVALAKELGFSQITLLTNGIALSSRMLEELFDRGLTHLTISIHTANPGKYEEIVQPHRGGMHEKLLKLVNQANEIGLIEKGLTIRFNVAYSKLLLEDESMSSMIAFAEKAGAQQITFIEMILGNDWARDNYVQMPVEIPGYVEVGGHHWGMQFFAPENGIGVSVAVCHFGSENETDATFAQQEKNLQLVEAKDDKGNQGPFVKAGDMYGFEGIMKIHRM